MTEKEAIENLKEEWDRFGKAIPCDTSYGMIVNESYKMAISALEEIQKYREIGTVEECREAMERQKAKKPVDYDNCGNKSRVTRCPSCFEPVFRKYCEDCGQAIDWN